MALRPLEYPLALGHSPVPTHDGFIPARGPQMVAVGFKGQEVRASQASWQGIQPLGMRRIADVPERDGPVPSAAAAGQITTTRRQGQCIGSACG